MKKKRLVKILEIIADNPVTTQEELQDMLQKSGYDVTQATVSRDIRELKIAKMTTGKGTYRYVLPKQVEGGTGMKFNSALVDSIVSVDHACNVVVLKTYPGMANAVAVGIDSMNLREILGSVAGDDTIIVVTRNESCAEGLEARFNDLTKMG